jgi:hypothetical protein
MFFNIINSLKSVISVHNNTNLDTRMRNLIKKYNSTKCHGFKPFIVTLKSKNLMTYINRLNDYNSKVKELNHLQDLLFKVSKGLYNKYDPNLIYTFQNEINLVFYYNEKGDYIYDGNINKMLTSMTSYISTELTKLFLLENIKVDLYFSAQFVEFDIDYEILNYLVWRQMDCKRNTITLLYKCMFKDEFLDGTKTVEDMSIEEMKDALNKMLNTNINENIHNLLIGNNIKKYLFYKMVNDKMVSRKSIGLDNIEFSNNFKENLHKYIINKVC